MLLPFFFLFFLLFLSFLFLLRVEIALIMHTSIATIRWTLEQS